MPELTIEQAEALARVNRAMAYLYTAWPADAAPLVATASAGALVELLQSPVGQSVVEVINQQWQATPWEIGRRKAI